MEGSGLFVVGLRSKTRSPCVTSLCSNMNRLCSLGCGCSVHGDIGWMMVPGASSYRDISCSILSLGNILIHFSISKVVLMYAPFLGLAWPIETQRCEDKTSLYFLAAIGISGEVANHLTSHQLTVDLVVASQLPRSSRVAI